MSQANLAGLYIAKQTDKESAVSSSSNFDQLRYTASPLAFVPTNVISDEIDPRRQVTDSILVDAEVSGGFDFQFSAQNFNSALEGMFFSNWSKKAEASVSDITSISSGSIDFDKDVGLFAGALILVESNDSSLNGTYEVSAWDSSTYTATISGIPTKSTLPTKVDIKLVGQVYDLADVVVSQSNKSITLGSGASDALDVTLLKGESVALSGLASGHNGYYRISSSSDNVYTYDRFAEEKEFTSPPTGKAYVLLPWVLRTGTTKQYYTILQRFGGLAGSRKNSVFRSCVFGTMELNMSTGSIINGTFGVQGFDNKYDADTYSFNEPQSFTPFNSTSNVGQILIGDEVLGSPNYIQEATVSMDNNLRRDVGIGTLGAVEISEGRSSVSGTLSTYFGDSSIVEDVINNTIKSVFFSLKDKENKTALLFDMPKIKYTEGAPNIEGVDTTITIPISYQALYERDLGYQISHQWFPYV